MHVHFRDNNMLFVKGRGSLRAVCSKWPHFCFRAMTAVKEDTEAWVCIQGMLPMLTISRAGQREKPRADLPPPDSVPRK